MLAPSATQTQPLASRRRASSASSSFWVAQGSAISQARPQAGALRELQGKLLRHSRMRPRHVLQLHQVFPLLVGEPRLGIQGAFESDSEITLPPISMTLRAYWATLPEPEIATRWPSSRGHDPEHFLGEVDAAEAGRLRADQAAAIAQALAGQHRGELVGQARTGRTGSRSRAPTPMSPAGTSRSAPTWRYSSLMNDWQKRITSASLLPFGSKSEPPCRRPWAEWSGSS
ncbi:hypothetical protein BANRA_00007 [Pseudomonas aeruginosa]|nr:hypothetical protein BANRA_00007 [Pseudomonas aeruginosa]